MTAITWPVLQTTLQAIIARTPAPWTFPDAAFNQLFPQSTSYAEQRIYHEMPFLAQRLQDKSLTTTPGSRSISLHGTALPIVVPQRISLLVGADTNLVDGFGNPVVDGFGNPIIVPGVSPTLVPFQPVSLDFIDMFWPNEAQTWAPTNALAAYWCIEGGVSSEDFTSPDVIIAPTPDAAYTVVLTGLFQQAPISATVPQTYLSTNYPELMISGCMIFLSGALLRNYSAAGSPQQPDEPGMPVHWEGQFQRLMEIAKEEEIRRLQQGTNWANRPPMPSGAPAGR